MTKNLEISKLESPKAGQFFYCEGELGLVKSLKDKKKLQFENLINRALIKAYKIMHKKENSVLRVIKLNVACKKWKMLVWVQISTSGWKNFLRQGEVLLKQLYKTLNAPLEKNPSHTISINEICLISFFC